MSLPPTGILFPTPYWYFKEPLPVGVYEWCLDVQRKDRNRVVKSNVGGYHSTSNNNWVQDFPYLKHLQNIFQDLPSFDFDNWWINIQQQGDYNLSHSHPGVDLSGIWFITPNNGTTVFENAQQHTRFCLNQKYDHKDIFANSFALDADAGDIILFPSDLMHHVKSHKLQSTRISVSFNIALRR